MNFSKKTFMGYKRPDGQVGVRNYLGVFSTVTCANQAAEDIARHVTGTAVFTHQQGCGLLRNDLDIVERTLINLGRNPNLGAVLVVSLGCEGVDAGKIAEQIAESGKPVETVTIQEEGGYFKALQDAGLKAQKLAGGISHLQREQIDIHHLRLGIKCGASDPTSGLSANPSVGKAVDYILGHPVLQVITVRPLQFFYLLDVLHRLHPGFQRLYLRFQLFDSHHTPPLFIFRCQHYRFIPL